MESNHPVNRNTSVRSTQSTVYSVCENSKQLLCVSASVKEIILRYHKVHDINLNRAKTYNQLLPQRLDEHGTAAHFRRCPQISSSQHLTHQLMSKATPLQVSKNQSYTMLFLTRY